MKKLLCLHYRPPLKSGRTNSFGQYYFHNVFNKYFVTKGISFGDDNEVLNNFEIIPVQNNNFKETLNLIFIGRSPRLTHFYSRVFKNIFQNMLNEFDPDFIYVEHVVMMQYLLNLKTKAKVILFDDESFLHISKNKIKKNLYQTIRNYRLTSYEIRSIKRADFTITITSQEAELLKNYGFDNIYSITYGIDIDYFAYNWKIQKENSLLFVGNFDHYPNRYAVKFIMSEIYPQLKKYDCKLKIVGRNTKRIAKYVKNRVDVHDNVLDMRDYYYNSSGLIAPIFSGAGLRIKILEAAACGIPIITTKLGNLGYNFLDDEAFIVENADEFNKTIEKIFTADENSLKQLTKKTRKKIEEGFSINSFYIFVSKLISLLQIR